MVQQHVFRPQTTPRQAEDCFPLQSPCTPHCGGAWEREIKSVKTALYTVIGVQPVSEEVLLTVLLEVEVILNSKPLGYTSSSVADLDAVIPNVFLMGRLDGALPPVVYPKSEGLSRRRWRHCQVLADHFLRDSSGATCQPFNADRNGMVPQLIWQ